MSGERASPRLIDQRHRNLIIDQLETLADGDAAVRPQGATEYFNAFFSLCPIDESDPLINMAMTEAEHAAWDSVFRLMDQAANATSSRVTDEELLTSGWPRRIASVAAEAVRVFLERGRSSEEIEEAELAAPPSH